MTYRICTSILPYSNEQKVKSNEQKVTSNEQKVSPLNILTLKDFTKFSLLPETKINGSGFTYKKINRLRK